MSHEQSSVAPAHTSLGETAAWELVRAAAGAAEDVSRAAEAVAFDLDDAGRLRRLPPGHESALLEWRPGHGWVLLMPAHDPRHALVDLYLPICSATAARPVTVGHLGQSIDGFIATPAGDSQFVTGVENLRHMHRLRALCDAVVVGAGTVAADDPQLTTRQVEGPNPLRVVIDPMRRLAADYRVFQDGEAPTVYVCRNRHLHGEPPRVGRAEVMGVDDGPGGMDLVEVLARLRARGCVRVFVEGGGVTVSAFLAAKLLDRVQVAVAPMLIGMGRPAIRLPAPNLLSECARPSHRVFRMGGDMLFDCDLRAADVDASTGTGGVSRVI
jgi:diaminohydroxyphosphoribosylaminopyrimidine deaminase/5-amino-6-(5-phosphoribosylamino)uracil reductase